ncbi:MULTISPECIES: hypothetical protein [unclassified Xanthomonas]|uniref:hypothetical protein n=1 Tax=unclassified Xanthomonas TaxID=2643310 RepID=UPI002A81FABC|nr:MULTISPECIES: hypothetical protein [unclassified Xanthomonas]MDY4297513.1 hypothetical protein [Xanthomonas sp. LF02-5]MDY4359307.1 hypothetical protein [Xanthomonas sp. LF04-12]
MCEITTATAAWLAIGATVGTGLYTADQQNKQGQAEAEIAANNERLAQNEADNANAQGTRESEQAAWRTRALIGQQRAAIAANNIDPTLGTPSEILGETAMFGEVDQQTIRQNAARQAWGYSAQATNFRNQGSISRWSGRAQATGTILGSLASSASIYGGASSARSAARVSGSANLGGSTYGRSNVYAGAWSA